MTARAGVGNAGQACGAEAECLAWPSDTQARPRFASGGGVWQLFKFSRAVENKRMQSVERAFVSLGWYTLQLKLAK